MPGCVVVSGRLPASYGLLVAPLPVAPLLVITAGGSEPDFLLSFRMFATAFSASVWDVMVEVKGKIEGKSLCVGSVCTAAYNAQSGEFENWVAGLVTRDLKGVIVTVQGNVRGRVRRL
jgi:hypothetical protein